MTGSKPSSVVVVVGGGAAGLMTAATVIEQSSDLTVTVLEKDTKLGSSAEIGSGTIIAAGTRFQREAGIDDDSAEVLAADIAAKSGNSNDPAVTRAVCRMAPEVVHWLVDTVGVPLELATDIRRVGPTRARAHAHPTRSGRPVIGALRDWVRGQSRVDFLDQSPVDQLVVDDGQVVGVRTTDGVTIRAAAVVLAAGGFGANHELVAQYLGSDSDLPYIGAGGHAGDGLRLGLQAGAATQHLAGYQGHGYYHPHAGTRINPGVIVAGGIMVNSSGVRFEREDHGYSEWARYVQAQPGSVAYAIWDERIDQMYAHSQSMVDSRGAGVVVRADNAHGLAAQLGLPADVLSETIVSYNAGVIAGTDTFGRGGLAEPLAPPFFATMVSGSIAQTLGGLRVDTHARVLRADGSLVAGLYAAGTTAAGVSGDDPAGYLSGSGLLMAFGLGRLAGAHSALMK